MINRLEIQLYCKIPTIPTIRTIPKIQQFLIYRVINYKWPCFSGTLNTVQVTFERWKKNTAMFNWSPCTLRSICRVYFLGGEKHWRGTWYDVELDVWGECEGRTQRYQWKSIKWTLIIFGRVYVDWQYNIQCTIHTVQVIWCQDNI